MVAWKRERSALRGRNGDGKNATGQVEGGTEGGGGAVMEWTESG
jgi:hypothetical protein